MAITNLKVAIVHDVLDRYGGAERVVEHLLQIWPDATVFTARHRPNPQLNAFKQVQIKTSFMQWAPFYTQLAKFYTPLFPLAFETMDLREYDLIFSSTAHFAKAVITTPQQLHICYCHTPPRFMYHYSSESQTRHKSILRPIVRALDHRLRLFDFFASKRPDYFITNSEVTAKRINKFYRRPAEVIYPPVPMIPALETPSEGLQSYFLVVSRLVAYKNLDTVIRAFRHRPERLIVVGDGPQRTFLEGRASKNVEFKGFVPDSDLNAIIQHSRGMIVATSDEDFGITPIEAMSAGKPIIALKSGGLVETVVEGKTGVFYQENSIESLIEAIERFLKTETQFDRDEIRVHAEQFSSENFKKHILDFVQSVWESR